MSATAQYIVAAEGLDIYAAGAIGNAFPWFQTNTTYAGQIVAGAGAFGGNGLSFQSASANQSGLEYQFPSTLQVLRNQSGAGGEGAFGVCGWISVGSPVLAGDTDILLALSSSVAESDVLPILGVMNSSTSGLNLVLPSTVGSLTNAPHLLSIAPNSYVWVGVYLSYQPTGELNATLCLAGSPIFQNVSVTFSTDVFTVGQIVNRLKFYAAQTAPWTVDDLVIHALSSADALWPSPATLTPALIAPLTPRQITLASATGNGSVDQMTASGSEPNWQSATDATGANSVIATAVPQSDRYKWSTAATDIRALVYRGQSAKYNQLSAVQAVSGVQTTMAVSQAGPNEFVGVSENDGTNLWTDSSVAAAEFGQISHP